MYKKLLNKRAELKATLKEKKGIQKGFTLIEMLIVLLILAVLIAVLVMQFGFLGTVDGTELIAEGKNVESAILQKALAHGDREFPGVDSADKEAKRVDGKDANATAVTYDAIIEFMISKGGDEADAKALYKSVVASAYGKDASTVTVDDEKAFAKLVYEVNPKVQSAVAGSAEITDYLVVVKKSQIATTDSDALGSYADELAGTVFSSKTVTDSDGKIYNGTNTTIE